MPIQLVLLWRLSALDTACHVAQVLHSGLLPKEAPIVISEKHRLSFSFLVQVQRLLELQAPVMIAEKRKLFFTGPGSEAAGVAELPQRRRFRLASFSANACCQAGDPCAGANRPQPPCSQPRPRCRSALAECQAGGSTCCFSASNCSAGEQVDAGRRLRS